MKLKIGLAAAALAVAAGLVACGGGGGSAAASSALIKGQVNNAAGAPVAGAEVKMAGATTQTQADGSFQFSIPNPGTSTVVLVKKSGFSTTAKTTPIAKDVTTQIAIQLLADQVTTSFAATGTATVNPNGSTVTIPANAVQTAGGAAYTGTVKLAASYRNPDTVDGVRAFAEPYASSDGARLQSVGVIEVRLTDADGNPLQLKTGSSATLVYPASSVSKNSTATSVPLWYYDETQLIWVRDGSATRQADGSFKGTVTHFTLWNSDYPYVDDTRVKGCFVDKSGNPVMGVAAVLWSTGWQVSGISDAAGKFESRVISGATLELKSWFEPPAFAPVVIPALQPNEVRQLSCIVIADTSLHNVWVVPTVTSTFSAGTVTAAYAGNYKGTFSGAETGSFNVDIATNGVITGTTASTTNGGANVSGVLSAGGGIALDATGTAGAAKFAGAISTSGQVTGTWAYVGPINSGGTFIGQRQ